MVEDERDRAGPEQGRERRDRKSTLRRKKKRARSGTRDRGNKPDGEFEGDGVNGDRRRMDEEEAGRQAGREKRGWFTKGTETRWRRREEGRGHRGWKVQLRVFSQWCLANPAIVPSYTVHPPSTAPPTLPLFPLAFAQQSVFVFILHPSFFVRWNDGKLMTYTWSFFLPSYSYLSRIFNSLFAILTPKFANPRVSCITHFILSIFLSIFATHLYVCTYKLNHLCIKKREKERVSVLTISSWINETKSLSKQSLIKLNWEARLFTLSRAS